MSYPFNYPTPTNANVQIFYEASRTFYTGTWIKPQGASFVWFTLIGAGGSGNDSFGGGSGAVTNCMVPAFLIPDQLSIYVGQGGDPSIANSGGATSVYYNGKKSDYLLLRANGGSDGSAGAASGAAASTSNYFSCMGFYQSIAGQAGSSSTQTASTTTFLSGGGGATSSVTGNYGYVIPSPGGNGFFQLQPIIVGLGASNTYKNVGIGCGGSVASNAGLFTYGGNGLCVIITW